MKFNDWSLFRDEMNAPEIVKRTSHMSNREWYEMVIGAFITEADVANKEWSGESYRDLAKLRMCMEKFWIESRRPYYNVWPSIAESLCRLPLDIKCESVRLPVNNLAVRFAVNSPLALPSGHHVLSMHVSDYPHDDYGRCLTIFIRGQDKAKAPESYVIESRMAMRDGMTVEAEFSELHASAVAGVAGEIVGNEAEDFIHCLRLACTLCLLGDNPDIIRPDVLEADRAKYDETHDPKYADRAVRRGKIGWDVGRDLEPEIVRGEVSPHYRRPHFGIRYCGEGGKTPRVVPIKGTVVRRGKLCEVPTGYLDKLEV